MRRLLFALSLLYSVITVSAQDTLTTYYNSDWHVTDKAQAKYYRKAVQKDDLWFVEQYNLDGNYLELSGTYKTIDVLREGHFIKYYKNGHKQEEGNYSQNIQVGKWTTWDANGSVNSEEVYLDDVTDMLRILQQDSTMMSFYKHMKLRNGYRGIKNGICTWYHSNGQMSTKEWYKNGKIEKAEFWDEAGNAQQVEVTDVYENTVFPQYKGKDLQAFIASTVQYPQKAWKQGIQGRVVIQFAVASDGSIVDIEIKKSLGSKEIDAEAIRVVKLLNDQFTPGKGHNRPAKIYMALPLNFRQ